MCGRGIPRFVGQAELDGVPCRFGPAKRRVKDPHPMPEDVGTSLAAYLTKGRPASSERLVLLSHHPPYQPLRSTGVLGSFVNSLLKQAGMLAPCSGTHVLRHTLATGMVRHGANFKRCCRYSRPSFLHDHRHLCQVGLAYIGQSRLALPGEAQ